MNRKILFVCTGNTCRSPMAAVLWNALTKSGAASSAGTMATVGMPLSRGAEAVFKKRGLSAPGHKARRVDASLLDAADSVYVMEKMHKDDLSARFPKHAAKVSLLREAAGLTPAEVEDPVGADAAEYEACAASIEEALKILVSRSKAHA